MLSLACGRSDAIFAEAHPYTLRCLFEVYIVLQRLGHGSIATSVLAQLKESAIIYLQQTSPLRQVIEDILLIDRDAPAILRTAWQCHDDTLNQYMDPFSFPWIRCRLLFIETMPPGQQAEFTVRSLLAEYEKCSTRLARKDIEV